MSIPGATSISSSPLVCQLEHAAFGHVKDGLPRAAPHPRPENVRCSTTWTNLCIPPSGTMRSRPLSTAISRPPAVKVPTKTTFLAFWLMFMKPPAPASRGPNLLTFRLPARSARRGRGRHIDTAAVVEIELIRLIDHRLCIDRQHRN